MKRKTIITVACALLALLMVAMLIIPILRDVFTATAASSSELKEQLKNLKNKQSELSERQKEVRDQIQALSGQIFEVSTRKQLLDIQIDLTDQEIEVVNAQLSVLEQEISAKQLEYDVTLTEEAKQMDVFRDRVREMEENGQISYYAILFEARSIGDLLSRLDFISEIMHYDEGVIDRLHAARDASSARKTELVEIKAEAERYQQLQIEKMAEREQQSIEAANLILELQSGKEEYEEINALLNAEREELDNSIAQTAQAITEQARKEAEERAKALAARQTPKPASANSQIDSIKSTGVYIWPLPASNIVTDTFGIRSVHPVTGKAKAAHNGLDIGAPSGTSIVAADSGEVIRSEYNSSYGNYVQIAHGNGRFTAYAHMSKRKVEKGDKVTQGQQIGLVGSTGISTGPHLHFETYSGGVRVDPLNYFSSKNLIFK